MNFWEWENDKYISYVVGHTVLRIDILKAPCVEVRNYGADHLYLSKVASTAPEVDVS